MDINEVRDEKQLLEHDILLFLTARTQEFRSRTGESVRDLSVTFHHFQIVGGVEDDYRLSSVSARVVL